MKKLFLALFIIMLFFAVTPSVFSQSAVYFCTETGAYGYAYGYSYDEVFDRAYNTCVKYGGTNPQLIASTEYKGFGAIALGKDYNGNRVIGVAMGYTYLRDAKNEAIRQCEEYGGYNVYINDTWEDY